MSPVSPFSTPFTSLHVLVIQFKWRWWGPRGSPTSYVSPFSLHLLYITACVVDQGQVALVRYDGVSHILPISIFTPFTSLHVLAIQLRWCPRGLPHPMYIRFHYTPFTSLLALSIQVKWRWWGPRGSSTSYVSPFSLHPTLPRCLRCCPRSNGFGGVRGVSQVLRFHSIPLYLSACVVDPG